MAELWGTVAAHCPFCHGHELDDGTSVFVDGFFVAGTLEQSAPFAETLGLNMLPSGCIEVDGFGRTSMRGVFAGGDLAHQAVYPMPLASVLNAAAAGRLAAVAVLQDLVAEDFDLPSMG
jgi:thioredoxin reductase